MFEVSELLKVTGGRLRNPKRNLKVGGISVDSRTIEPGHLFIAIKGNNFDGHDFINEAAGKGAACIIKERRKPQKSATAIPVIEVKDSIKALGSIARYHRERFNLPVIGVTGSNGKTTTKEMIAHVLSVKFKALKNEGTKNNHIGLPLTLLNLKKSHEIAVVEIGTNHFGEVAYLTRICKPTVGVVTNIGPSHLEYLVTLDNVFREKYALIDGLCRPNIALLNADDKLLAGPLLRKNKTPFSVGFGIREKADFRVSAIKFGNKQIEFLLNRKYKYVLRTPGLCNVYNALAAIATARLFGIGHRDIISSLSKFSFPKGRLNLIRIDRVEFIDDTYNSNPLSLKQALDTLVNFNNRGRKIFIMGDMLELGPRGELFHYEAASSVKEACDVFIAVGKLSRCTALAVKKSGFKVDNIFVCESSESARDILRNKISPRPQDVVLVKGSRSMRMEEVFKI